MSNYISDFRKLIKEGYLEICTEHNSDGRPVRIRTVVQLDADLLTFLPRKHLDEIMDAPDIYQAHLKKLHRYLAFMKWLRISFVPALMGLASGIVLLGRQLF